MGADETIATERLLLRRFQAADAAMLHGIMADAEAMRFWSTPPHQRLEQTEAWLEATMAAVASGLADEFAVCLAATLVGKAGLWRDNELGLIFAPSVWGRGYAREAAAAVLARADAQGRPSVVAEADPRNARVLRLLDRLGFHETGRAARTFCLDGEWSDSVFLARPRPSIPSPAVA